MSVDKDSKNLTEAYSQVYEGMMRNIGRGLVNKTPGLANSKFGQKTLGKMNFADQSDDFGKDFRNALYSATGGTNPTRAQLDGIANQIGVDLTQLQAAKNFPTDPNAQVDMKMIDKAIPEIAKQGQIAKNTGVHAGQPEQKTPAPAPKPTPAPAPAPASEPTPTPTNVNLSDQEKQGLQQWMNFLSQKGIKPEELSSLLKLPAE